jgi:hypothetical protein
VCMAGEPIYLGDTEVFCIVAETWDFFPFLTVVV